MSYYPTLDGKPQYTNQAIARWFSQYRRPGSVQIIGIGDSHMAGGILPEPCFMADYPSPRRECSTLAVGGYNLADYEALFEQVLRYNPDVVVIALLDNDCYFPPTIWDLAPDHPEGTIGTMLAMLETPIKLMYRVSYTYRFLWFAGSNVGRSLKWIGLPPGESPLDLTRCTTHLTRMIEIAARENITLVTFLSHQSYADAETYPRNDAEQRFWRWFLDMNRTYNLSAVILRDAFRGIDPVDLQADLDGHYNEQGYEIARHALQQELVRRGIIWDNASVPLPPN